MIDLIIRNAQIVTPDGINRGEIAIDGEVITEISSRVSGPARLDIDAHGAFAFPGFVDAHVHFNEPGRENWEGLSSGSRALAAGGGTSFFDMPLNSDPPVLSADALILKRDLAAQKSLLDFALWGGLCPGHIDRIDEMAEAGAVGFKGFLCPSGIDEFPATDPATLRKGLTLAKKWSLPVAVHAESPAVLAKAAQSISDRSMNGFLASRPKEAETAAIQMACEIAGETGGALHVVHVSCAEGWAEIAKARAAGVDVTAEVCPHYLIFTADDARRIGSRAKCAPPLREKAEVEALWAALLAGMVDTIGSDHSPAPPEMKVGEDFFEIWGGISGCQHAFPSFLGELRSRAPEQFTQAAKWLSAGPAARFGLGNKKGRIAVGFDADITLIDFRKTECIQAGSLLTRHRFSLYENHRPGCHVTDVIRRGRHIVHQGRIADEANHGVFLRPAHG